jgi:proteasome lid subunit RPN8/RPN11
LLYLRDFGETEVGGFGICPHESLLVEDFQLVNQTCTYTTVALDDESVADFFDEQVDQHLKPDQFARVWMHTHPGECPMPSGTDEETFSRVFGQADWAVMFILACGGESYTRLRFNVGPGADLLLQTEIEFEQEFAATDFSTWENEYRSCVEIAEPYRPLSSPFATKRCEDLAILRQHLGTDDHYGQAYLDMLEQEEQEDEILYGHY